MTFKNTSTGSSRAGIVNFAILCKQKLKHEINKELILELSKGEHLILWAIVEFWDYQNNLSKPSIELLQKTTGYSKTSAISFIQSLEKKRFIKVQRQKVTGRSKTNKYSFTEKILQLFSESNSAIKGGKHV